MTDDDQIDFMFYEKPVKGRRVINKTSALPNNVNMKTMTLENYRLLHNTKSTILEEFKCSILNEFMQKLKIPSIQKLRGSTSQRGQNIPYIWCLSETGPNIPLKRQSNPNTICTYFTQNFTRISMVLLIFSMN